LKAEKEKPFTKLHAKAQRHESRNELFFASPELTERSWREIKKLSSELNVEECDATEVK
jgi:hypothetical protein